MWNVTSKLKQLERQLQHANQSINVVENENEQLLITLEKIKGELRYKCFNNKINSYQRRTKKILGNIITKGKINY